MGKGFEGLDPRPGRRGPRKAQAEQGSGARLGPVQGSGQGCPRVGTESGQRREGSRAGWGRAGVGAGHLLTVAVALRLSGLQVSASRMLTIWEKRGR